jgi:alpha-D-glucose phosphate-specific phosphoglucomutase
MASEIKFGTDGWRAVLADDFTFDNVRRVAAAIASYVLKNEDGAKGLVIGYDTRFLSQRFAETVAEVAAAAGIPVKLANDYTPTPAVSFAIRHFGAAGGVVVTSSHNPWNWNGIKYKASYGGSATTAIIGKIEQELRARAAPSGSRAPIEATDFKQAYVAALTRFVDVERIARANLRFAIDCMHGSGRNVLAGIFQQYGVDHVEIRSDVNPLFPGINPEPIEPHVAKLQETVKAEACHAGLATDGDADRIGAVAEDGTFVDSHKIYSILLRWLLERKKWPGEVVKAFNTTKMVDRIARRYGRRLHETGIGFKYICELILEREILIGGEESGGIAIPRHLPERDGILNSLLLANVMAEEGRSLGQLVADLQKEYGEHHYGRVDARVPQEVKEAAMRRAAAGKITRLGAYKVLRTENTDGIKFYVDAPLPSPNAAEAWLLMRSSGTEPLMRLYAEAGSRELVQELLSSAEAVVQQT